MHTIAFAPRGRILALALLGLVVFTRLPLAREAPARASGPVTLPDVDGLVARELPGLEGFYKHLHTHPELTLQEHQTSARLAEELKKLGFAVTSKVGST